MPEAEYLRSISAGRLRVCGTSKAPQQHPTLNRSHVEGLSGVPRHANAQSHDTPAAWLRRESAAPPRFPADSAAVGRTPEGVQKSGADGQLTGSYATPCRAGTRRRKLFSPMPWRARSGGSGAGTPGSSSFAWSDPRLGRAGMARRSSPASERAASSSRPAARRGSCRRGHSARRPRVTTRRAAGAATRARRPAGCGGGGGGGGGRGQDRALCAPEGLGGRPFAQHGECRKHRPGNRPQAPKQETWARQTNVLGRSQEASTASARDRRSNYVQSYV